MWDREKAGNRSLRALLGTVSAAVILLAAGVASAAKTFYIDESTDYTGNGCENDDVNDVTSSLAYQMVTSGWTGERWVNGDAWPQDFIESCSSTYGPGADDLYADSKSVAVFAGHGNVGLLGYGYKNAGLCTVDFKPNMRLGSMGGDTAAIAMYLGCDALLASSLSHAANYQWLRQQLGWQNTIAIDSTEVGTFFDRTGTVLLNVPPTTIPPLPPTVSPGDSNADAWLSIMGIGSRQSIVVSYGTDSSSCWTVHDGARLKDNTYTSERPSNPSCGHSQPSFYYCYETL